MMSQMFAKTTGLSKGRDSALHSGVTELGIFGNTSMLGANLPVAAGLGLTFKMEKSDNVVIAYFGEGASNTGDFHEALNFAGVQQLPIVFICENNQYAYSVPVEKSMAIDDVADRAAELRLRRRGDQRQRRPGGVPGDAGRARARPRRRGSDAHRVQDLSLARPLRARQGVLSHRRRARDVEEPRSDPDVHDVPEGSEGAGRREAEGDRSENHDDHRRRGGVRDERAGSEPEDAATDLYA